MSLKSVSLEKGSEDLEIIPVTRKNVYRSEVDTSGIDERQLLRRIDLYTVPWLSILYCLSFLDRSNIGNAKLYGMTTDLHISDKQYLIALTVFFLPYSFFELPSNIVLRKLRPSRWLAFIVLVWGIMMTLHGVVHNFAGLAVVRSLLGIAEAGLYPGIIYYLSCWYKRSERGTRIAVFFSSATIAGAFSGFLAVAIEKMDGVGGKPGWAWIFIIEGLFTVCCAVPSFWIIQDFPDTATFLTETERVWVVRRLQDDMTFGSGREVFKLKYVKQSLTDWKTWCACESYTLVFAGQSFLTRLDIHQWVFTWASSFCHYLCFAGNLIDVSDGPVYAFAIFTPTIINQVTVQRHSNEGSLTINPFIGYEANMANLLSAPVYIWACLVVIVVGIVGDRTGKRGCINLGLFGLGLIGYIILIISRNPSLSYFAVYFAVAGIYPVVSNSAAWMSNNVEGSYKRSATLGMIMGWANLQGAVSSNIVRSSVISQDIMVINLHNSSSIAQRMHLGIALAMGSC
ncbi:uncharacterized protein FIBRA_01008 [Fibroporia radiculosa]|uniref:Major facilitator superfamily (MFS) profile domain-containing protein n=1 Tax=Fibroporia radiculosa TaxID=599839 RepID=J4GJ43_9APHY|nr:uncharacterized protein FIBRA_01008 [Fibroporia radiculosa]CCL99000.1 predicted protein [Fibroporia radiculosa]